MTSIEFRPWKGEWRQLCKFRISYHKLAIETGRYHKEKIDVNQRHCILCSKNAVETELHFIFSCPFYDQLRQDFFSLIKNEIQINKNNDEEFIDNLMNSDNETVTVSLSIFINKCLEKRNHKINEIESLTK